MIWNKSTREEQNIFSVALSKFKFDKSMKLSLFCIAQINLPFAYFTHVYIHTF